MRIVPTLPPWKRHFTANKLAVIEGSYATLCKAHSDGGTSDRSKYGLNIKGEGYSSWYDREELILIERVPFNVEAMFRKQLKKLKELK